MQLLEQALDLMEILGEKARSFIVNFPNEQGDIIYISSNKLLEDIISMIEPIGLTKYFRNNRDSRDAITSLLIVYYLKVMKGMGYSYEDFLNYLKGMRAGIFLNYFKKLERLYRFYSLIKGRNFSSIKEVWKHVKDKMGISYSTVRNYLKEFEGLGFLKLERDAERFRKTKVYWMNDDRLVKEIEFNSFEEFLKLYSVLKFDPEKFLELLVDLYGDGKLYIEYNVFSAMLNLTSFTQKSSLEFVIFGPFVRYGNSILINSLIFPYGQKSHKGEDIVSHPVLHDLRIRPIGMYKFHTHLGIPFLSPQDIHFLSFVDIVGGVHGRDLVLYVGNVFNKLDKIVVFGDPSEDFHNYFMELLEKGVIVKDGEKYFQISFNGNLSLELRKISIKKASEIENDGKVTLGSAFYLNKSDLKGKIAFDNVLKFLMPNFRIFKNVWPLSLSISEWKNRDKLEEEFKYWKEIAKKINEIKGYGSNSIFNKNLDYFLKTPFLFTVWVTNLAKFGNFPMIY